MLVTPTSDLYTHNPKEREMKPGHCVAGGAHAATIIHLFGLCTTCSRSIYVAFVALNPAGTLCKKQVQYYGL